MSNAHAAMIVDVAQLRALLAALDEQVSVVAVDSHTVGDTDAIICGDEECGHVRYCSDVCREHLNNGASSLIQVAAYWDWLQRDPAEMTASPAMPTSMGLLKASIKALELIAKQRTALKTLPALLSVFEATAAWRDLMPANVHLIDEESGRLGYIDEIVAMVDAVDATRKAPCE